MTFGRRTATLNKVEIFFSGLSDSADSTIFAGANTGKKCLWTRVIQPIQSLSIKEIGWGSRWNAVDRAWVRRRHPASAIRDSGAAPAAFSSASFRPATCPPLSCSLLSPPWFRPAFSSATTSSGPRPSLRTAFNWSPPLLQRRSNPDHCLPRSLRRPQFHPRFPTAHTLQFSRKPAMCCSAQRLKSPGSTQRFRCLPINTFRRLHRWPTTPVT